MMEYISVGDTVREMICRKYGMEGGCMYELQLICRGRIW